jgi:hypothetical protein
VGGGCFLGVSLGMAALAAILLPWRLGCGRLGSKQADLAPPSLDLELGGVWRLPRPLGEMWRVVAAALVPVEWS